MRRRLAQDVILHSAEERRSCWQLAGSGLSRLLHVLAGLLLCGRVEPGREIAEPLRIRDEDIDVLADPVAVASHQSGAAAETPLAEPLPRALGRIEDVERVAEERLPEAQAGG